MSYYIPALDSHQIKIPNPIIQLALLRQFSQTAALR